MADSLTLTVDGQVYAGWERVRITRGIEFGASEFDITVSERWAQQPTPWQIKPFQSATLMIGSDLALTGFVERYEPSYRGKEHSVRIAGRSKTCDVCDSMPDVASNFNNQTLDAIAQAASAPFGVNVVVQAPMGDPFPIAVLEKTETAHAFIERLCRMRSVLATDDENGNLVLTQAGLGGSAEVDLIEGQNIEAASASLNVAGRYQTYVVLSQVPEAWDNGEATPVYDVEGSATDSGVPRPRRFAEHAEESADQSTAQARAKWRQLHSLGKATEATITVVGWRQSPDGSLWKPNQTVYIKSPMLELDRSLLVGKVTWLLDGEGGARTELTLAPPEAYTPESLNVNNNGNVIWTGH